MTLVTKFTGPRDYRFSPPFLPELVGRAMKNKTKRISLSVEAELAKEMRSAASKETAPTNLTDFTRKLVGWAWPHYRAASSSLWLLRHAVVRVPKLTWPGVRGPVRKTK